MVKITVGIEGMACGMCEAHINEAVRNAFQVKKVTSSHIFYAVKMGEKYLERYHMHFKNPDIRRHDMQHEELLICYPERWTEEIRKCCEI